MPDRSCMFASAQGERRQHSDRKQPAAIMCNKWRGMTANSFFM